MAINEQIVKGRKFRKCINVVNKVWQRISFWTDASDVEFADGETAEDKVMALSDLLDALTANGAITEVRLVSSLPTNHPIPQHRHTIKNRQDIYRLAHR